METPRRNVLNSITEYMNRIRQWREVWKISSYIIWAICYYGIIIGCLLSGCYTHNTASYAVLASIGVVVLLVPTIALFVVVGANDLLIILLSLTLAICGGLFGGFTGYTWDNYCVMKYDNVIHNATASAPQSDGKKFVFDDNVFVINSMMEEYSYKGEYWYAAPVVECPESVLSNGSCHLTAYNGKVDVGFYVVSYKYDTWGGHNAPNWNNKKKEASRLKLLNASYYKTAMKRVKNKNSDYLSDGSNKPYLVWQDFDSLTRKWEANAIGTLVGAILAPIGFPISLAIYFQIKR